MNDLIEHFGTVITLLTFFVGVNVMLVGYLWRSNISRIHQKIDELSDKLDNAVTITQCQNRHDELIRFIGLLLGCKNCQELEK
jgi:hypothetical protein